MDISEKIANLERALALEKKVRKNAEKSLEEKSRQLSDLSNALEQTNQQLQQLLSEKTSELEGVFSNIIDAYVVMDIQGNVIRMNEPAKTMLGFNPNENQNLLQLVHPDYQEYTDKSFKTLYYTGSFKNYQAKIITKNKEEKTVQINASIIYDTEGKPKAAQGIVRDITLEIEKEKLLEEQKSQLDIIIDNSPLGISLLKPGIKGFLKVNDAFCSMLGYTCDELLEKNVPEITYHEDHEASSEHMTRLRRGEIDFFSIEKRYVSKYGEIIWAKTTVSAVFNKYGEIKFQIAIIEDIRKEMLAKSKLRESEDRLSNLVSNLQAGVLLEDEDRNVLLVNEMLISMFEMESSVEDMLGQNLKGSAKDFMDYFKEPEKFLSRIKKVLSRKVRVIGEELELKDGRVLERNYTPIFSDGVYKGHLWSFNDISLQKNYKNSLRSQKDKYSNIIANMDLGLLEINNEGTIMLVNQSFSDITGFKEEELIGNSATQLFKYHHAPKTIEKNFLNLGVLVSEPFEIKILTKEGDKKYLLVSGAPNFDVNGTPIGYILVHLDITKQKNLEIQKGKLLTNLEKQNEQLNEYAHIVSHDLKSPLRNISALLSWTKEDFRDKLGEESLMNLDLMQQKLEKMDHLIENILKYSSVQNDSARTEKIDLNTLVEDVLAMLFIPKHITVHIEKKLPVIRADATRIQQVFQNLIGNAIAYIDKESGTIQVSFYEKRNHYIFSVKDNGMGIAPQDQDKIFKIFKSFGDNEMSSGIGLSIVKKIVELYKGKIWVESDLGKGSIFYFSIRK